MKIGVPAEIKDNENRIAINPSMVQDLTEQKHTVFIKSNAGTGSGISDKDFKEAGAVLLADNEEVYSRSEMIIKVKEPLPEEYQFFQENQILFTYIHLAADKGLTDFLLEKNITAIGYETVQVEDGSLPLLTPMSEIAGKLAVQEGVSFLTKSKSGKGILPGGVAGVSPARIVIIGGGTVGKNSARIALGLGAEVTVLDIDVNQLRYLEDIFFQKKLITLFSSKNNIYKEVTRADLIIGAVLIPGAKAPNLITEDMVKDMKKNTVMVDVAIDQGGCIETMHPTTYSDPVYKKHDVIHYGVANIPGAVPRTATFALTNATQDYIYQIAEKGFKQALLDNSALLKGLNVYENKVTNKAVAESFGYEFVSPEKLL
ncbi:MAG: alanine dehydrogenase [Halanaerobiales bacterium]